jgi:hypothetical protein
MWGFISHPGLATAVLDFTDDFLLLGVGLLGLTALSGGVVVYAAIRHFMAQKIELHTRVAPAPTDHRRAA